MRGTMPVSDLRVFDGDDTFGLISIEDKDALEFLRWQSLLITESLRGLKN